MMFKQPLTRVDASILRIAQRLLEVLDAGATARHEHEQR
jgi:hypothetical protein